ncbi:MAG: hypothetical protein AB1744_03085 [Candidatus Zixiibacteriota bacterium]
MRVKLGVASAAVLLFTSIAATVSADTEQEIVEKFLKQREAKHTKRITWISGSFNFNRINRSNDYNRFAIHSSQYFVDTDIPWIGDAKTFGLELGMIVGNRFAWTIGGEYWLKMGVNKSGPFTYDPPADAPVTVDNLKSEVRVWGLTSSIQCYLLNPPTKADLLARPALRLGASVGFYQASWDLWDSYQNLNLATSAPEGTNTTYKGTAPGFTLKFGVDYPLRFHGLVFGVDFGLMYLNFTNVAWYNTSDQEVVVTYNESADSRVDLNLTGFTGKVEIKKFFKL